MRTILQQVPQRWQGLFVLACAAYFGLFLLAAAFVAEIEANPDVTEALAGSDPLFQEYEAFRAAFDVAEGQEVLLVRADDLGHPASFAALEDLVFELQFAPEVSGVLSILSLPAPGAADPFIENAAGAPEQKLTALLQDVPYADRLLSAQKGMTMILIDVSGAEDADSLARRLPEFAALVPDLELSFVGQSEVNRVVADALLWDQTWITPISIVICLMMAFVIMRSLRAALCCAVPPFVGVAWFMGLLSATGTAMDPFLAVMPTLLIALAFADCAHVFYATRTGEDGEQRTPFEAIVFGLRTTAPAAAMTSLTTSIAFCCFLVVGTEALSAFAIWGPIGFLCTFASFCIGFPISYLLLRPGVSNSGPRLFGTWLSGARWALGHRWLVGGAGLVCLGALLPFAGQAPAVYGLEDYVDDKLPIARDLKALNGAGLSSANAYVVIADADAVPGISDTDQAQLANVALLALGKDGPAAAQMFWHYGERLISEDALSYALPLPWPIGLNSTETLALKDDVLNRLETAGLSEVTEVTGQSVLAAQMVPQIIGKLRLAFYISLLAVTAVVALYLRSVRVAILGTFVSAMPVLAVEALVMTTGMGTGGGLTMVGVIALTLAFGIAVDDTIHFLNRYRLNKGQGHERIIATLDEVGPPVVATTLILLSGLSATVFGSIPSLTVFASLVGVAISIALLADLFLLPSLMALTDRITPAQQTARRV